mgnify:CR=1 FL=1
MQKIVNGYLYDTDAAEIVASDRYWDGHNWERNGRNTYICRTPGGRFFLYVHTLWESERDVLEPISQDLAMEIYERLPEHEISYADAFGEEPHEA